THPVQSASAYVCEISGLASIDEAIRAVRNGDREVVVFVDDSFGEDLASEAGAHVTLVYDESDTASGRSVGRIRGSVGAYSQQIGTLRLLARGLDPSVVRPLIIDNFDVSTAEERSSLILGMLTYFLLFATLMGGLHLATDTTAGERERKSLEPLLATPVSRSSLILGKMGATTAYMLLSLALTLACFAVSVPYMSIDDLGMSASFGPVTALTAFLVLLPFAPLGAALMTAVACFTKSYKEAQSYLGFVILVPTLPLILASILNVRPSLALMAVPSLSQHLLITNLIRAEPLEASMLAVSVATTLLLGVLVAYTAVRLYERERILG
ncbi:MAG: ABC transporter permease, partial [Rhodospirillaceae bacterium]|nr:ABC transporter permease [Rhodospirillaceae bacterium]